MERKMVIYEFEPVADDDTTLPNTTPAVPIASSAGSSSSGRRRPQPGYILHPDDEDILPNVPPE
eukprot:11218025-Karenia_brevis.AAC.1